MGAAIGRACREHGFFYAVGHGVDETLQLRLEELSRRFFALPADRKGAIRMELGGRAWRGYFPVGAELTLGRPDRKEGLYFGSDLGPEHPRVAAGVPLHGPNLYPDLAGFRETVCAYQDALTMLGHRLLEGVALGLGMEADTFAERLTRDPTILFRIFHYPPLGAGAGEDDWSVGEHTDYGLLTILRQDESGGLEVKVGATWVDAPPLPGSFVCNLGDMLERLTGGVVRSTPHRVRNRAAHGRLSLALFFDPDFDARVTPLDLGGEEAGGPTWDGVDPHAFRGTYGDYLLGKVSRVFPGLGREL